MIDIKDVEIGMSYACKFRVETMLNEDGQPPGIPTFHSSKLKGPGLYESIGIIMQRDMDNKLVRLKDKESLKEFVISFDDIWDIDTVEWVDPL